MSIKNYGLVESVEELSAHLGRIAATCAAGQPFGFDCETGYTGPDKDKHALHPETNMVVGISFTNDTTWARYAPLAHDAGPNLDNYQAACLLWPILNTGMGVAHNVKFELRCLAKFFRDTLSDDPDFGEAVRASRGYFPVRSDTQVEAYLVGEYQFFGLKPLTKAMFEHEMTELHELFEGLKKNQRKALRFNPLPLEPKVVNYACEDALWCLAIHQEYYPQVKDRLLYRAEMGVITDALCDMEDEGVCYDWPLMRQVSAELEVFRDKFNGEIMAELSEMTGTPTGINLASPKQIGEVLYDQLGMKTTVYTPKTKDLPRDQRKMSTGKIALTKLAAQHPVVKRILQWKEITKLLTTYLAKYETLYSYAEDGRTHPNHLSAFVVTGRFSVSDPPYQQSPKKYHFDLQPAREAHALHAEAHGPKCKCDEFPPPPGTCFQFNFRDCIIAPPGHYILGFDLSQAELRAIAGEAKETALLEAFANGDDVHTITASLMLGIPVEQVSADDRAVGKAQPVDEPVLTPTGWRPIGELKVGDEVIARDGTPTRVTGVYPQGVRQVYRLGTVDGAEVRASDEHWWEIHPLGQQPRLMTTEELAKQSMSRGRQFRWFLPRIQPAQLNGGPHPIDPYVLGLLIGDGSFTTATPIFTSGDQELADAISAALPIGCKLTTVACPTRCSSYRIVHETGHPNRLMTFLRHLGLAGKTAHHKFVPRRYLYGDPATRLAILQGLLDSDGTNNGAKGVEFVSASRQLCADVQELIRSLGGRANMYYKPGVNAWRLWGRLPADVPPFRLARKLAKMKPETGVVNRAIKYVEPDGHAECVCISVEHPERLYITRGYIPTHNTMNFALLYGMGVKSLADRLGITVEHAQALMDKYFAAYPNIKAWSDKQVAHGQRFGYVTSRFGRRLPIWEYKSDKRWIQQKGDRACVNYPIQGAATGDYVKIGMVRAIRALKEAGLHKDVHLVMNVHDALEFYVAQHVAPRQVIEALQPAVIFPVEGWPAMQADWHIARRWGSPVEVELIGGQLVTKGSKPLALTEPVDDPKVTDLEEDEDTGEQVEVMPEVTLDALRQAAGLADPLAEPAEPAEPGERTVVVSLTGMPDEATWNRFLAYLGEHPGANQIEVRTPDGGGLPAGWFPHGVAVTPSDRAAVAMILGPVTVAYTAEDVDLAALGADLQL